MSADNKKKKNKNNNFPFGSNNFKGMNSKKNMNFIKTDKTRNKRTP
jgi:hypothetical protein